MEDTEKFQTKVVWFGGEPKKISLI